MLASVLCGLRGHMQSPDMHAHKTFLYIKYTKHIFFKERVKEIEELSRKQILT